MSEIASAGATATKVERRAATPVAGAVAGILFAVLFGVSITIIHTSMSALSHDTGEWLHTDAGRLKFAVALVPFAGLFFLWFIAVAREGHLYSYELTMKEKEEHLLAASEEKNLVALYGIELSENSRSGEVVISYLSPMGIGYQKGLKRGDVVKSLNGRPVGSLVDFNRSFRKDGSEIKSVEIIRDEKHFTVGFSPDNE